MDAEERAKCAICGDEGHPYDIEIYHRGCRLSAAFPGAYRREGRLLSFDPTKMKEHLEKEEGSE